jgi:LemA protein
MKRTTIIFLSVIAAIAVIITISLSIGYNNLVDKDETIDSKYSQIEVRLQERYDKIGQIVNAVTGLQEHAETIYEAITDARIAYANAVASGDTEAMIEADAAQAEALNDLLVVVEDNSIAVNAGVGYAALIDEISSIESALAVARRDYNLAVQDYNSKVRKFPTIMYANIFGFEKEKVYWKMNDGVDEVPEINFGD